VSNVEMVVPAGGRMSEFDALVAAGSGALEAIPGAVYLCDHDGWLVRYNSEAAALWGRTPQLAYRRERFCGSHRLFLLDGTPLAHEECPMADAIRIGTSTRNAEVMMERPDGSRFTALVNIRSLKDQNGNIQGAINCFQDVSARKQIDEELAGRTRELEDFFENGAVGLHIVSGDGIILRANKAELDLLGYTPEEYVGHHISEFHADAPVIGEILDRLSCGEKLDKYPARLRTKDGSIKHVLITSNSRFDGRRFANTRCFTIDATGLHQAEKALRASEERLNATYEAASVGIAEADEQGRLLRVNGGLCQIIGKPREKLLGSSFFDYTHPDDKSEDAERYAKQVRGELESYSVLKKVVRPDGELRHVEIFSSSVRDEQRNFLYGVRVTHDVTLAKRLERELRDSERRMRDLLEAIPAAIYTTDPQGRITFYNKASVEMAGRVPEPGDEWCVTWRLYRADGTPLPHDQCPMAIALKENRPVRGVEAIAERPDGSRVSFIPYPTPLHDEFGNLVGAVNMLVDISERKAAENRQKVLVDELNHRVKNTLAVVQSLASQTARYAETLDQFNSTFQGRLMALARAHDLLSNHHWQDAQLDLLVRDVVLATAAGAEDRVHLGGPAIRVDPRIALNLAMVLNELATNATKYGALSAGEGVLSLTWRVQPALAGKVLSFEWFESRGPATQPPKRRGFGSRLMERCIERDLAGQFDLIYDPAGLQCRISLPLAGSGTDG
jgi:PAS domain S-box-containing protein